MLVKNYLKIDYKFYVFRVAFCVDYCSVYVLSISEFEYLG